MIILDPNGVTRRDLLRLGAAGAAALAGCALRRDAPIDLVEPASLGIPGPFPGRVVEVSHPLCVVQGEAEPGAVATMVQSGMSALTGAPDVTSAWRRFFAPGDSVGIKVNPVGVPLAISSHALVREVVSGLRSAGVRPADIVVFDRYRSFLIRAGFPDHLPAGVRWDAASADFDDAQLDIDGYDRDVYREIDLISARFHDPKDDRIRRSHVCLIATRRVNKIINLPVLKDHGTAGVTLALKNLSHGLVNNVRRSHDTPATNACAGFIPAIVSLPVIRSKVVLHILDGTRAIFDGGPSATARRTWNHGRLYFATDPVALDRIGWEAIDAKRRSMRMPAVADMRVDSRAYPDPIEPNHSHRQPQHIAVAAAAGLGVFDRDRLRHERIDLGAEPR